MSIPQEIFSNRSTPAHFSTPTAIPLLSYESPPQPAYSAEEIAEGLRLFVRQELTEFLIFCVFIVILIFLVGGVLECTTVTWRWCVKKWGGTRTSDGNGAMVRERRGDVEKAMERK